jgi:DNA-binding GntR family transcriptional regulator
LSTQSEKLRPLGRPKGSGSQLVYDELRNQILTLTMKPGTLLDELALVRIYNLSRTPVREALIKLEADRLVEIVPNRGARVAPLDLDSISQLFEALDLYSRAICHLAATRRHPEALSAARRANQEFALAAKQNNFREMGEANWRFHYELGRASRNSFIADAQTRIMTETMRLAYLTHYSAVRRNTEYRSYFDRIVLEHNQILDNVEAGNAAEAEDLARQHTRLFQENIAQHILQNDLSTVPVGGRSSVPSSNTRVSRHAKSTRS